MSAYSHHEPSPSDLRRLLNSAHTILDTPPPPTLKEILTAYRTKGDGDRDMLLAMLGAKTAEDQRLSSLASLHRTMLEICQHSSSAEPSPYMRPATNGAYHYPTPSFTQSPRISEQAAPRRSHHPHSTHRHTNNRASSRSRSPAPRSHPYAHQQQSRDVPTLHHPEPPRKRHRSSRSPPHAGAYDNSHPSEQFPPSPYSTSGRSESAEYSPRSRASMTIGSLLSSGPSRDVNGDPSQERD